MQRAAQLRRTEAEQDSPFPLSVLFGYNPARCFEPTKSKSSDQIDPHRQYASFLAGFVALSIHLRLQLHRPQRTLGLNRYGRLCFRWIVYS